MRVSSKNQSDSGTPENQRTALDRLRITRPGILVARIEDGAAGISGALGLKDRPDLQKLFALLAMRAVDEVRVYAIDRLSRSEDGIERATVLEAVKKAEAVIVSADGTVTDPGTQTGELMGMFSLLFASWEKENIKGRTQAGRIRSAIAGKPAAGNVPYAIRYDRQTGTWVVVPDEAEVVRDMFRWAAAGEGISKIEARLATSEKRTRRGIPWNRAAVRWVLHSHAYVGTWKQIQAGQEYSVAVPAIIDQETFDKVQAGMQERRKHSGAPYTSEALCRGVALCGVCGRTIHVGVKRTGRVVPVKYHSVYACASRREGKHCGAPTHRAAEVDRVVWEAIVKRVHDPALLEQGLAGGNELPDTSSWEKQIAICETRIAKVSRRAAALAETRADGLITDADYDAKVGEYQREKVIMERSRDAARKGIADASNWKALQGEFAERLAELQHRIEGADFQEKRSIVEALVPLPLGPDSGITIGRDGKVRIKGVVWSDPPIPPQIRPCGPQARDIS